ncbi:high choriolytic enzyme 1-like isoform X2 [Gouania willdenowi]|uniref:high choriolytic enzyme 1-like isoform X2 n=1 Tax=Gouania willdenowi TaxID=441366 RepID=UPI001056990C|nr:high choriolytic enzyme 1-like isoform X2 [Gouania willdenowi]
MESIIFSFIFFISAAAGAPSSLILVTAPLSDVQQDFVTQEGDILVPTDRNAVQTLWADAVMFYVINKDLANREADVLAAMNMISSMSCIRFKKRTNELNYVTFTSGEGCASFVGCRGGSQPVFFSPTCSVGNICHELIHALGFHHEHTRMDRDQFIDVHWDNIQPGKERNFEKKAGDTQNLAYDLESIMHYGKFFFASGSRPTVEALHGGDQMGQREHLSSLDAQRLNMLYRCEERRRWQEDAVKNV